jgi:S1-C subfamily serine protease
VSKVAALKPGAPVDIRLRRGGQTASVKIKVLERPTKESRSSPEQ